jgi:Virulence factor
MNVAGGVTRYRVLAWRGIPAQVKAEQEGMPAGSVQLDQWFTEHIDRVAMRDGLFGSDEYLAGWDWSEYYERDGSPEEVARAVADELEAEWAPRRRAWEQGEEI